MTESEVLNIKGIGPKAAKTLIDCGYNTIEKIATAKAEEMSQLPGIGETTAEKIIAGAKELLKPKPKPKPKPKVKVTPKKEISKDDIPKPPSTKEPLAKKPAAMPSARPSVKKPEPKVVKKPTVKPSKPGITISTQRAIEKAPAIPVIKKKKTAKKKTTKKKVTISKTYGVVQSVVHDRAGKSSNRSIILHLHELEMPIESYIGRKVRIQFPKSEKQITGKITRLHGKKSSKNNTVIVRFQQSVSPHIVTAKALFL